MKTVVNNLPKQEIKYPCLMRGKNDEIALFNSSTCGFVLNVLGPTTGYIKHHQDGWWTPLPPSESVTLTQE